MEISIKDAAELIGKSERTVRHMAQTGRLPARRVGARWLIDRDDLLSGKYNNVSDEPEEVPAETLTAQVETETDAEAPAEAEEERAAAPRPRVRWDRSLPAGSPSVRALDSFHIAAELLAELGELRQSLPDAPLLRDAENHLRGFIQALADGCHADGSDQPARLRAARTAVCAALTDLIHFNVTRDQPDLTPLVDRIEHELLSSLQGLIVAADLRSSWRHRARTAAEKAAARLLARLRDLAGENRFGARLASWQERLARPVPAVH